MYYIIGLGNPGDTYTYTRHNAGRLVVDVFLNKNGFPSPILSAKYASLVSEGKIDTEKVSVLYPETFMNKSGSAVKKLVTSVPKAKKMIVVYDDIDLPLGTIRVSYGRGAGGHRGVESIIRAVKTKDFVRIRVGIAQTTPKGKLKKPRGEDAVVDFLMKDFKKDELEMITKKVGKQVSDALVTIIKDGYVPAMNQFN